MRITADLASVPVVFPLVGPKVAEEDLLNIISVIKLCLAILFPPHPHDTAWCPVAYKSKGHIVQGVMLELGWNATQSSIQVRKF